MQFNCSESLKITGTPKIRLNQFNQISHNEFTI